MRLFAFSSIPYCVRVLCVCGKGRGHAAGLVGGGAGTFVLPLLGTFEKDANDHGKQVSLLLHP